MIRGLDRGNGMADGQAIKNWANKFAPATFPLALDYTGKSEPAGRFPAIRHNRWEEVTPPCGCTLRRSPSRLSRLHPLKHCQATKSSVESRRRQLKVCKPVRLSARIQPTPTKVCGIG